MLPRIANFDLSHYIDPVSKTQSQRPEAFRAAALIFDKPEVVYFISFSNLKKQLFSFGMFPEVSPV